MTKDRKKLWLASTLVLAVSAACVGLIRAGRRFRLRQFPEGEIKPTGWLATTYAAVVPYLGGWLYEMFARRLDLQHDDDVLDVACGSGEFLRKHATHVRRVAGLDHSEDLIDIARHRNAERVAAGTAEFVVGDVTALPWDGNRFTVVTCNCIDCFAAKSTPALAEMYRVLQPGGRVLVADDHSDEMESIGFTDVSVEHVLWGDCTTGYKQAV